MSTVAYSCDDDDDDDDEECTEDETKCVYTSLQNSLSDIDSIQLAGHLIDDDHVARRLIDDACRLRHHACREKHATTVLHRSVQDVDGAAVRDHDAAVRVDVEDCSFAFERQTGNNADLQQTHNLAH